VRAAFVLLCLTSLVACGSRGAPEEPAGELWKAFSGENALKHVQALVDCGPRPPETPEIECARNYIAAQLESFGWRVERQSFTDQTPRGQVKFVNLLATFSKDETAKSVPSFLLCSHYDTKLFTSGRFVGANDGGSSNGILLEAARVLAQRPQLAAKVQLVFFDGEEAYVNFTETDGLYGSRHFARQLAPEGKQKQFRGGILFDMIGDKSLRVTMPPNSPAQLARGIFAAADALNVRKHFTYFSGDIMDDHTPLNAIGLPTIDLIDFEYPPWHTLEDTMDKISAESLQIVGSVALRYLVADALK
jgi:hypothetical protein